MLDPANEGCLEDISSFGLNLDVILSISSRYMEQKLSTLHRKCVKLLHQQEIAV